MVRAYWKTLAVAAGLGLAAGCSCTNDHHLFGRHRDCCPETGCATCEAGCPGACPGAFTGYQGGFGYPFDYNGFAPNGYLSEGPVLGQGSPVVVPGPGPGAVISPPMAPQTTVPPLSPAPRLVPMPQAQPTPYVPQ